MTTDNIRIATSEALEFLSKLNAPNFKIQNSIKGLKLKKQTVDKSKDGEKTNCETCETCQYWRYENEKAFIETCNFGNIEHSYRADSFMCNNYKHTEINGIKY